MQPGGCEGSRRWRPWTSSWVRTRPGSTTRGGCSCRRGSAPPSRVAWSSRPARRGASTCSPPPSSTGSPALMQGAPGSSRGVRDFVRVFRASAHPDTPDKQGRVTVPAPLRAYAQPRQGVHGHRQRQQARGLGLHRLEHLPRRGHARLLQLLRGLAGGGSGALTPRPAPDGHHPTADHDPTTDRRPDCRPPADPTPDATSPAPGPDRMGTSRRVDPAAGPATHRPHPTAPTRRTTMSSRRRRRRTARPRAARPHRRPARAGAADARARSASTARSGWAATPRRSSSAARRRGSSAWTATRRR